MFSITVDNFHWILGDLDDPNDLCLHGRIAVKIGDETFEDDKLCVSAAGLYLLRTLTENRTMKDDTQPIFPCYGTMFAKEDMQSVMISGCPNGF